MFYTVYKITNKVNNKFYIGKHQTKNLNDDYMGSGKLIVEAINLYGKDNFIKEILFVFDNENDMNDKEKELVLPNSINVNSYNLCSGGNGGFSYINNNKLNWSPEKNNRISGFKFFTKEQRLIYSKMGGQAASLHNKTTKGISKPTHWLITEDAMKKKKETFLLRGHQKGENNSQFGSRWTTNGIINKKIKKDNAIPDGFKHGYTKLISNS